MNVPVNLKLTRAVDLHAVIYTAEMISTESAQISVMRVVTALKVMLEMTTVLAFLSRHVKQVKLLITTNGQLDNHKSVNILRANLS